MTATSLTPELVLVDPELAQAQRQTTRKAAMSSTEPANGMFFVDQAQPAPTPDPQITPLTPPASVAPPPVAAVPEPAPVAEPAAAPAPVPAPSVLTPSEPSPPPMVDVPLGTLIFRAGLLAEEQLEDALQEGMRTGKRLGEVLIERGWIAEKDLGRMLAGQKGLPYIEVTAADAQPDALRALPEQNARLQAALPLYYENGQLTVAVADPSNELVIENLRRALGAEPQLVVAPHGELLRAIGEAYTKLAVAPVAEPAPAPAPEPEVAPAVQAAAPAPAAPMAPAAEPQPEPVQPLAAPTPLPTVLPPAEERSGEPSAPASVPVQAPVVAEVAPEAVQPIVPAPPAEPVVEAPAPVAEEPAAQPAPVVEAVFPAEAAAPAPAPEAPVEPAAIAAPEAEPQQPEPAPGTVAVVLRLGDGERLEVGTFASDLEASTWAQEIVRQISSAEGQSTWPFFANRYVRPDTIVSVDLVEESADRWLGSSVRRSWAEPA